MQYRVLHKLMLVSISILLFTSGVYAQKLEITPFGGYFFAGKLTVPKGDLNFKNGGNYGVAIGLNIQPQLGVEFTFNRLDTRLVLKDWRTNVSTDLFDISVNYFHLGAVYEATKIEGGIVFTTFSLGATLFSPAATTMQDPDDPSIIYNIEDDWRFSIGLGAGIKKYISEKIGLRLQIRLLMPIYWGSAGLYFGTGGSGLGISAGTALIQGDATIGLIFRL